MLDPRNVVAGALGGVSTVLSAGAKIAEVVARQLRPDEPDTTVSDLFAEVSEPSAPAPSAGRPRPVADDPAAPEVPPSPVSRVSAPAPVEPATAEAAPANVVDDSGHARTAESQTAALASRPAADVVRALGDLSTEELGLLFEHERAHRTRKTVLSAIERALAPSDSELVHSTETPSGQRPSTT